MDSKTIEQIIKKANERLLQLLEEAKAADIAKEKRELEILKIQSVIELFTPEIDETLVEETTIPPFVNDSTLPLANIAPVVNQFKYSNLDTWEERIKAFFKFKNRVLTISQIVEAFELYEPSYTKEKLKGAVTNAVAMMHKNELLRVYKPGFKMRGFYYGNPLWFEGETLKEEHKPDLREKLLW